MSSRAALLSFVVVLPLAASAHHSRSQYPDEVSEIAGELVDVHWANPHVGFTVKTINDDGAEENWRVEAFGNVFSIERSGLTREMFAIGQRVRVAGHTSTRRARDMLASNMLLADGTDALLNSTAEPYFSERAIGGAGQGIDEDVPINAASENRGIFRVWSNVTAGRSLVRDFPFTQAAIAARGEWDPDDNFTTRCEQEGMPRIMTNPHPFEFVDDGERIVINSELYDTVRTVHMDRSAPPSGEPASHLGYSVGRWEGESLIVTTTRVNWPYFDNIGTPQSGAVEFVERFTVSDDQSRLDYELTITDPATFDGPATYRRYWLALGEAVRRYDCQIF